MAADSRPLAAAPGDGGPAEPALMAGAPPFAGHAQVTLANWSDPPFNRWAFQHIRELIPTASIGRPARARPLPRAERDLLALRFTSGDRELSVADLLAETYTDGFLVLHRGQVVTELYRNGLAPATPHLLMSVSKSVTGMLAGILAGRGQLDPAALVTDVVPELRGTSFDGATVRDLLDMRAGTKFNEDYDSPDSDVRTCDRVYLWRPDDGEPRPSDALAYFPTLVNDGEHGGPFRYRSILTDVLGWVLERAGGARLHELIARELWQPMGAEFDAAITVDGHGNALADGGICAALRDVARFGQLVLDRGQAGGQQVVPAEWIEDTIRGAPDGPQAFGAASSGAHYRNYWWVDDPAIPFLHAVGINGQHVFVHGAARVVVVKLSTWPTATSARLRRLHGDAAFAIAEFLS